MILVNGVACDTVDALDRGLAYGDGVFRTLAIRAARPQCWQRHYRKLAGDCAVLGIPCPAPGLLRAELAELAREGADCAAKIIVTRGAGTRGYAVPAEVRPIRIVISSALPQHPPRYAESGVALHLCRLRLGHQPALAGIKHLNRLENVLARTEANDASCAEGLLLDFAGNVIGGTMANVFIAERGGLATPDLGRCGVAGATRERVIEYARAAGIACRIENIGIERLLSADEVFLVNSLIGVWQVRELQHKAWSGGGLAPRVREWLEREED